VKTSISVSKKKRKREKDERRREKKATLEMMTRGSKSTAKGKLPEAFQ